MMRNAMITALAVGVFLMGMTGCRSADKHVAEEKATSNRQMAVHSAMTDRAAAADTGASYVTEIAFDKGSTTLSSKEAEKLKALIDRARANGKIDEVKVISWADMEYPSVGAKKLPKAQRDLAARRGRAVESQVKAVSKGMDVDTFNMAERPNALENLFRTQDSRVKKSLEAAGIPTTDSYVKIPAKASKSIVMLVMEK